jgi:hypothetical protein
MYAQCSVHHPQASELHVKNELGFADHDLALLRSSSLAAAA